MSTSHHVKTAGNSGATPQRAAILTLLIRLHFYIGLFVGPFIFIAALTGTLYVLTPQIEDRLYSHQLYVAMPGTARPLAQQIGAAQAALGARHGTCLLAVRPAPTPEETTRVMFALPELGASESHTVFVDPGSLEIRGQLTTYGTSGILPFRTWLDYLHRGLLLGDIGRNYSELAASWLWVAALGGVLLWWQTRRTAARRVSATNAGHKSATRGNTARTARLRRRHATLGLSLLAGLLFFSATGLTWSQWAGANISLMRDALGWLTPSVNTQLYGGAMPAPADEHAEHHHGGSMAHSHHHAADTAPADIDHIVAAARQAGIDAGKIEIRPARARHQAWTVSEIDRRWPTQVDAVAVNPETLQIVDRVAFSQYPLAAKLTRWGVDAHMGILFGLPNQLALAAFGCGLCLTIVWGYRMWWIRRPRHAAAHHPANTLFAALTALAPSARIAVLAITGLLAWTLPVMGVSLLLFMTVDVIRWYRHQSAFTRDSAV